MFENVNLVQLTTGLLFIYLAIKWLTKKRYKLPPGPQSFPIIGSTLFIGEYPQYTFSKWAEKYGSLIYVKVGPHPTVILNSPEAIELAFLKMNHIFGGRYQTFFTEFANPGGRGIMFLDDPEKWKIQRRFGSRALSGMCLQGKNLEARSLEEADLLCEVIRSKEGKPFVLEKFLTESIANVVNGITLEKRCQEPGNEGLREFLKMVIESFRKDGLVYIVITMASWMRFIPPIKQNFARMKLGLDKGNAVFDAFIDERAKHMDKKNPVGFIDTFLAEQSKNTPSFEKAQLRLYLKDLLSAGTETSSSTLRWTLFHLILQPDIQKRVHEEIDRVIGSDGVPRLDSDLPYTRAVLQEVYRCECVVPLGVPRRTYQDVKIMGYDIPKNTQILPNIWHVHNDSSVWPNPRKFDPERHLDKDGKFVKSDKVIAFSVGPRNCIGENLARIEIFVFFVRIMQKFTVLPNKDNPVPNMVGTSGPVYSPNHYPLILKER